MMSTSQFDFAYRSSGASDIGTVRKLNEDSFVTRDGIGLWAVLDGVGGHDAGDVASRMLAEALAALPPPLGGKTFLNDVEYTILAQNKAMLDRVASDPALTSMGTTVVALLAFRDHVACLWVGDSRCYRLRGESFEQISNDHSLVQELVDAGHITEHDARSHPRRNVVTRAVGVDPALMVDQRREQVLPGDRFLLCSDGLTGPLEDAEIAHILHTNTDSQAASNTLIARALEKQARDNVTVIVIDA
ncbi:MAG: PP2C family serine/threonine-protein phosphatase [Pseudomonadota bacterium]